jgi:hypothetical protein
VKKFVPELSLRVNEFRDEQVLTFRILSIEGMRRRWIKYYWKNDRNPNTVYVLFACNFFF